MRLFYTTFLCISFEGIPDDVPTPDSSEPNDFTNYRRHHDVIFERGGNNVRPQTILSIPIVGAILVISVYPASAWWQFVANGPNGERQVSPHFSTEKECKSALKVTESRLAKKFPERYPLVGSC